MDNKNLKQLGNDEVTNIPGARLADTQDFAFSPNSTLDDAGALLSSHVFDDSYPGIVHISKFDDHFSISDADCLGQGGFGTVYKVVERSTQRIFAAKVFRFDPKKSGRPDAGILEEACKLISLKHPNIVRGEGVGYSDDGFAFILMELMAGGSLRDQMESVRSYSELDAVAIAEQATEALVYLHQNGVWHRDIKPENMMFDEDGNLKLADLGLAMHDANYGQGPTDCGSILYSSPEQCNGGASKVDGRTDIYSLGIILYEMVVGSSPYRSKTKVDLLEEITAGIILPIRQKRPDVSKTFEDIVLQATQRDVAKRYPSASEFLSVLKQFRELNSINQNGKTHNANGGLIQFLLQSGIAAIVVFALGFGFAYQNGLINGFRKIPSAELPAEMFSRPLITPIVERPKQNLGVGPLEVSDLPLASGTNFQRLEVTAEHPSNLYVLWIDTGEDQPAGECLLQFSDGIDRRRKEGTISDLTDFKAHGNQLILVGSSSKPLAFEKLKLAIEAIREKKSIVDQLVSNRQPWVEFQAGSPKTDESVGPIERGIRQNRPRKVNLEELDSILREVFSDYYGLVLLSKNNDESS